MKKKVLMSAAKKAQIALAVMAVCGMSFVGAGKAFAEVSDEDFAALQAKVTALETAKNNSVVSYGSVKTATGVNSVTIGNGADNGAEASVVIGNAVSTTGPSSVVIGDQAEVTAVYPDNNRYGAIAIGYKTISAYGGAIAMGTGANGDGHDVIAIGTGANAHTHDTIAIGSGAAASGGNAMAFGQKSSATGGNSMALGMSSVASNSYTVAVGHSSTASGNAAISEGYLSNAGGDQSIAIGLRAATIYEKKVPGQDGSDEVLYTLKGTNAVAIGNSATAVKDNAIAMGTNAIANEVNAVALGYAAKAYAEKAVAIGYATTNSEANTVAVGSRRITQVADGTVNTDAATYGQLLKTATYTLNKDGGYSVTLLTNNGSNGPTINLDTTGLGSGSGGGTAMDQATFNNYLANSNMGDLLQNSFDAKADKTALDAKADKSALDAKADKADLDGKANVGGDNIATGDGSKWAEKLGTGAIASGDTNLVNGDTVYNELRPEDGNYVNKNNTTAANLSALDAQVKANADAIGTYSDDAAKNIDKNASVKANISALDNEIGSYDPNTTQNVISTDKDIKSNLSSIDKYMGDIKKIGTEDYSIIDRTGKKVDGDTLNVADILNVIDDKVGDLNKENKYVVEDEDGNLVEIGSYNHIDGQTSLAENMEELDAAIGSTADGAYVSSKASVGENLNALDNQVAANTNAINRLDNKVNKVGAGAAALAALHPLDFDPDDKLTFAAGFGNYQGENAVALGAFYRPDEKVMFSVAGNMGNGENMINAGVSFALDRTHKGTPSKAVMAKKLAAQDEQLAALNNTVATQSQEIAELKAMVKELSAKK